MGWFRWRKLTVHYHAMSKQSLIVPPFRRLAPYRRLLAERVREFCVNNNRPYYPEQARFSVKPTR